MAIVRYFDHFFIDASPVDLWRLGNGSTGRWDHTRIPKDVRAFERLYANGCLVEVVKADGGGISIFTAPNPDMSGKHWYQVKARSAIPLGLMLSRDHQYDNGIEHYTLAPLVDMPLRLYWLKLVAFGRQAEYRKIEVGRMKAERR